MTEFRKVSLCQLPTPLHRLPNLSELTGLDLWIKRDDLTGFAGGGNKGRKIEFLISAAQDAGAKILVTYGSTHSNFIRQLAAAAAMHNFRCVAVTMAHPYEFEPASAEKEPDTGNRLLDEIFGAEIHEHPDGTWDELEALAKAQADELQATGAEVMFIPVGGSSPQGVHAFVLAAQELSSQPPFDTIVFASSSGSTHSGLLSAFHGTKTRILGIACDPEPEIGEEFAELLNSYEARQFTKRDFDLNFEFVGPGYGVSSNAGLAAISLMARSEGILLDPIYTGKAFAALLELANRGDLKGRVLFWHTGGVPGLFTLPLAAFR
jgi:1-aminocyclopropane-1-carboxylate deaminase/D-cysteine desulfhydrase-like pyridoxal-dependent ACC family enzyme